MAERSSKGRKSGDARASKDAEAKNAASKIAASKNARSKNARSKNTATTKAKGNVTKTKTPTKTAGKGNGKGDGKADGKAKAATKSKGGALKAQKSGIAKGTLEKLRARLEEERATYTRQAEELAAEAEALMADREPGDTQFDEESGEGDTLSVERERDLALSATARAAVEEIDEALARIKAGTYGLCLRCEKKIPVARLEAVPHAALCIECKSRQERRR